MTTERYRVRSVVGYRIRPPYAAAGGSQRPGCSASVLDSLEAWRAVETFQSEDRPGGFHERSARGVEGAIAAAEELAAELNAAEAA